MKKREVFWLSFIGLFAIVALFLATGCASLPEIPTPEKPKAGCHMEFSVKDTGERIKTFERLLVVGEYDVNRWKVNFPDRGTGFDWLPYEKSKVSFACPRGFNEGTTTTQPAWSRPEWMNPEGDNKTDGH